MQATPIREATSSSSARDGLYNATRLAFSAVSSIATSAIAARVLGPAATGVLAYVLWSATLVALVAGLGMQTAATKFVAELLATGRENAAGWLARRIVRVQLWTCLVATPVVFVLGRFSGAGQVGLYLVAAALMVAFTFQQTGTALLAGGRRYRIAARITIFTSCTQLLLFVAVAAMHGGVFAFVAAQATTTALQSLFLHRAVVRMLPASENEPGEALTLLAQRFRKFVAIDVYLVILDQVIWQRTEVFFLALYADGRSVAIYAIAIALSGKMTEGAGALFHSLWPAASHTYARDGMRALRNVYRDSLRMVFLVVAPLAVAVAAAAPAIIHILYGSPFESAIPVTRILFLVLPLSIAVIALNPVLYAGNWQAVSVPMDTATAVLNIALDVALIPRYGLMGAVVAGCVPQVLQAGLLLLYLSRRLECGAPWKSLARIAGAVFVPGSLAIWYTSGHPTVFVSLIAAFFVLAGSAVALVLAGEWTKEDTSALRSAFPSSMRAPAPAEAAMTSHVF